MNIKQIAVFLENKKGRLAEVSRVLAEAGINIRALSLTDTTDFGVLRIIVNDPDKALAALKMADFVAQVTEVIAVKIEDKPGGLAKVLNIFDKQGINIEYMYAFVEKLSANAIVIFKIDEQAAAIEALQAEGVSLLTNEILKNL